MITEPKAGTNGHASSEDDKIAEDDPSLAIAPTPRRVLRPAAVIAGIATLTIVGLTGGVYLHRRSKHAPIAAEPKAPTIPRSQTVPPFLAAAPATPTPSPLDPPPRVPAQPLPLPPPTHSLPVRPLSDPALERALARQAELDEEARSAGVFFQTADAPTRSSASEAPLGELSTPSAANGAQRPPGVPVAGGAESWDQNLQDHKNAFLKDPRNSPDYLARRLQRPVTRFELKASSLVPATLITGINSDLPGPITAQVRERVYDTTTGDHLLIPQGARLFGWYDSKVAWGQERVLMCWDRIIFPNGNSINLECMPAADLQGQAGLTDEVDNHWDRLAVAVGFSTVLSLGAQAAAGDPAGYQPNLAQRAAANAAGQINSAGQAIVQRQLNLQPTITVRPGFPVNLIVTKDILLEPYVEGP
jgi:type IV secretion system protein TrbI